MARRASCGLFLCGWASNARGGPDGLQNHLAQQFDIQGHAPSGEPLQARPGARMARSLGIGNCDVGVCVGADAKTLFLSTNSMSIGRHPLRQLFRDQPSLCACARAEKRNNGGHSRANLSTAVDVERREERSLQTDFSQPHDFADLVLEIHSLFRDRPRTGSKVCSGQREQLPSNLNPLLLPKRT